MFNFFKRKNGIEKEEAIEQKSESQIKKEEIKAEQPNFKKPLKEIEDRIKDKNVIATLKSVMDPELGIDIWTLELIYDIDIEEKDISIKMTFTTPFCPYGPQLVSEIKNSLIGIGYNPFVEVVFSPPWQPSDEVKEVLGMPY